MKDILFVPVQFKLSVLLPVLVVGFAFFTTGFIIFDSSPKLKEVFAAALTRQPDGVTELYFEDHQNLPKVVDTRLEYSFEFTIRNLEHHDREYNYVILAAHDDIAELMGEGRVELSHQQQETIEYRFRLPPETDKTKIIVGLLDDDQSIHFWLENEERGDL